MGAAVRFLRGPDVWGRLRLTADLYRLVRLHWLGAAVDSGLLQALSKPATREKLAEALRVERDDLLDVMLELGRALGELAERGGVYSIKGSRARALAAEWGDAYAALLSEQVGLHADGHRHVGDRLRGGSLGHYLEQFADVVARSSRMSNRFRCHTFAGWL